MDEEEVFPSAVEKLNRGLFEGEKGVGEDEIFEFSYTKIDVWNGLVLGSISKVETCCLKGVYIERIL